MYFFMNMYISICTYFIHRMFQRRSLHISEKSVARTHGPQCSHRPQARRPEVYQNCPESSQSEPAQIHQHKRRIAFRYTFFYTTFPVSFLDQTLWGYRNSIVTGQFVYGQLAHGLKIRLGFFCGKLSCHHGNLVLILNIISM